MIQVWEAATGKSICMYQGHNSAVKSLAWSPDSKYVLHRVVMIQLSMSGRLFPVK